MVKFNRKLDTGDSDEDVVLKKGESYEWGYGYTKSKETMVEEHAKEGHFKVNFGVDGVPEDSFGSYLVLSLFFLAMLF